MRNFQNKYYTEVLQMESFNSTSCTKCGASWLNGQLYWSTGQEGDPHDLAGLVCNNIPDNDPEKSNCINPCKGSTSGQTWEMRAMMIETLLKEKKRDLENLRDQFEDL